jgi:hypothetical protein
MSDEANTKPTILALRVFAKIDKSSLSRNLRCRAMPTDYEKSQINFFLDCRNIGNDIHRSSEKAKCLSIDLPHPNGSRSSTLQLQQKCIQNGFRNMSIINNCFRWVTAGRRLIIVIIIYLSNKKIIFGE